MRTETIVVCGLARCGTSLLMKMLHRGGIEPLCDPASLGHGYELDYTLLLPKDTSWVEQARGKAIKILDPHVLRLPMDRPYRFVLLTRDFKQQAKSHVKFLKAIGAEVNRSAVPLIEKSLRADLPRVIDLLNSYPDSAALSLTFEGVISDPLGSAQRLDDFLERDDFNLIEAASVVLKRTTSCLPYLLEAQLIGA